MAAMLKSVAHWRFELQLLLRLFKRLPFGEGLELSSPSSRVQPGDKPAETAEAAAPSVCIFLPRNRCRDSSSSSSLPAPPQPPPPPPNEDSVNPFLFLPARFRDSSNITSRSASRTSLVCQLLSRGDRSSARSENSRYLPTDPLQRNFPHSSGRCDDRVASAALHRPNDRALRSNARWNNRRRDRFSTTAGKPHLARGRRLAGLGGGHGSGLSRSSECATRRAHRYGHQDATSSQTA